MRSATGESAQQPVYTTSVGSAGAAVASGTTADPAYFRGLASGGLATGQVSVGTSATQIVAARSGRNTVTITNVTGAQQVFIGLAGVTIANGHLLPAAVGASITLAYTGAIFGIAVTAAQTVSFAETF